MKFKQDRHVQKNDLIDSILRSRGITDVNAFKNPMKNTTVGDESDPLNLSNIIPCVERIESDIESGELIGILVDGDADGFCSAAMMYKYLLYREANVELIVPPKKTHGLSDTVYLVIEANPHTVIIPDGGSNDFSLQKMLILKGVTPVIIDHHEMDDEDNIPNETIIVNNELSTNGKFNKNFSGVGMVLSVLRVLMDRDQSDYSVDYWSLFAIGQIADATDVSDIEVRAIMYEGLNSFPDDLIQCYFADDVDISSHDLSFSIIPQINAVSRIGTLEERIQVIKTLAGIYSPDDKVGVQKRRKDYTTGKMRAIEIPMNQYEITADMMKSIKGKQDTLVKKAVVLFEDNLVETPLFTITTVDGTLLKHSSITGLIANKFISKYEKPTFVLFTDDNESYQGSGRGLEKVMPDFRQFCNNTELFEFAQGHANAFGVDIITENIPKLINIAKESKISVDTSYGVSVLYNSSAEVRDIEEVVDNMSLFGGNNPEPMFGYQNVTIQKKDVRIRGNVVTMTYKGVTFIDFHNPKIVDLMQNGFQNEFTFDIYGSPASNDWGKTLTYQIIIRDIEEVEKVENINNIFDGNRLIF